jgi:hypothetical protein
LDDLAGPQHIRKSLVKIGNAFFRQRMTNSNDKFFADPTGRVIDFIKLQDFSDRFSDVVGDFEKEKSSFEMNSGALGKVRAEPNTATFRKRQNGAKHLRCVAHFLY